MEQENNTKYDESFNMDDLVYELHIHSNYFSKIRNKLRRKQLGVAANFTLSKQKGNNFLTRFCGWLKWEENKMVPNLVLADGAHNTYILNFVNVQPKRKSLNFLFFKFHKTITFPRLLKNKNTYNPSVRNKNLSVKI